HQVVQAADRRVADVHARPLTNVLQIREVLEIFGAIVGVSSAAGLAALTCPGGALGIAVHPAKFSRIVFVSRIFVCHVRSLCFNFFTPEGPEFTEKSEAIEQAITESTAQDCKCSIPPFAPFRAVQISCSCLLCVP